MDSQQTASKESRYPIFVTLVAAGWMQAVKRTFGVHPVK